MGGVDRSLATPFDHIIAPIIPFGESTDVRVASKQPLTIPSLESVDKIDAESHAGMQGYIVILPILVGVLGSVTLSVIGVFVLSCSAMLIFLVVPFERPITPIDIAAFLGALQASYVVAGWMATFVRRSR